MKIQRRIKNAKKTIQFVRTAPSTRVLKQNMYEMLGDVIELIDELSSQAGIRVGSYITTWAEAWADDELWADVRQGNAVARFTQSGTIIAAPLSVENRKHFFVADYANQPSLRPRLSREWNPNDSLVEITYL